MIEESFVSFETAKMLKEKGFDEETRKYYPVKGDATGRLMDGSEYPHNHSQVQICAPTLWMARQWLDETYDVRIFILPARDTDNYMCHVYVVWKINESSGDFEEVYMSNFYEDYDECMEGAIDYCVESLV